MNDDLRDRLDELEAAAGARDDSPEELSEKEREHIQQMVGDAKDRLSPEQREELDALAEQIDAEEGTADGRRNGLTPAAKEYLAILLDGDPQT